MANPRKLPPEPRKPRLAGGSTRPSKLVSRAGLPAIARREALNEILLSSTCPFDAPKRKPLRPDDIGLLRQIAHERFGGEHALLRRESVTALGTMRDVAAIDALTSLALSPLEHGAIRGAASEALSKATPALTQLLASRAVVLPATAEAKPTPRTRRRSPAPDRRR